MEKKKGQQTKPISPCGQPHPIRYHLDDERRSVNRRFEIHHNTGEVDENRNPIIVTKKGHFIIGTYTDGTPGELFVFIDKEGSELHGWANAWSVAISMLLQFGVDPRKIYKKFKYMEFDPKGLTNVKEAVFCKSLIDLIMKCMEANFPPTANKNLSDNDGYFETIKAITENK